MSYAPPPRFPQEPPPAKKANYWWWVVPLVIVFGVLVTSYYVIAAKGILDSFASLDSGVPSEANFFPSGPKDNLDCRPYTFPDLGVVLPLPGRVMNSRGDRDSVHLYSEWGAVDASDPNSELSVYALIALSSHHQGEDSTGLGDGLTIDQMAGEQISRNVTNVVHAEYTGERVEIESKQGMQSYRMIGFCGIRNKGTILFYVYGPDTPDVQKYFDHIVQGIQHIPVKS